jgi:hypothetical protein
MVELQNFFPGGAIAAIAKQSTEVASILRNTDKCLVATRFG